jgi:hypothetical protein
MKDRHRSGSCNLPLEAITESQIETMITTGLFERTIRHVRKNGTVKLRDN